MAIMEVQVISDYQGQSFINRWNYISSGTPAVVSRSFALVASFGALYNQVEQAYPDDTILRAISEFSSADLTFQTIVAKDVYSVTDFYSTGFVPPYAGGAGGTAMSPVASFGFESNRVRSDIRRGQKRFSGLSENAFAGGGAVDSAYETLLNDLATRMSDVLSYNDEGNTITFTPCIVQKESYTTPSGKTAYRYYATESVQLQHTAVGVIWSYKDTMRTQVSRQYGRGG